MTTMASKNNLAWLAELTWESRYIPMPAEAPEGEAEETPDQKTGVSFLKVWDCFVEVFRPGCEPIRFRVNRRKDRRLTFTDPRGALAGTAGTTGLWGTLPALRPTRPSALTPTGFKVEVTPLIGAQRAEELVQALLEEVSFETPTTPVKHTVPRPAREA